MEAPTDRGVWDGGGAICLLGYLGLRPMDIEAWCVKHDAMLIDIRYEPRSRAPWWNDVALEKQFKGRYIPIKAFGNVNFKTAGAPIEILNFDAGWEQLQAIRMPPNPRKVVLMCACRQAEHCHRRVLENMIFDRYKLRCGYLDEAFPREQLKADRDRRPEGQLALI